MDIVVPARVPLAALVPELVQLAMSRRPAIAPPRNHDDPDGSWIIGRIGHAGLSQDRSLAEHGIVDGTLLHLQRRAAAEPEPLFDDVIDAVAVAGSSRFAQWDASTARRVAVIVAVACALAGAALLLWPSLPSGPWASPDPMSDAPGPPIARTVTAALIALAATGACPIVSRTCADPPAGAAVGLCALPFAFGAGALAPAARIGAPGVLLGAVAVLLCAVTCVRVGALAVAGGPGLPAHTAAAGTAVLVGAAAAEGLGGASARAVGAGLLIAGVAALSLTPRLTVLLSRLPLPPVPSRDVQADLAGDVPEAESGPGADGGPAPSTLSDAAARSGAYLAGLTTGGTAAAAAGAVRAAWPSPAVSWPAVALAAVTSIVLMLRGRAHADRAPAAVLVAGGASSALVVTVLCGAALPGGVASAAAIVATGAAAALLCGIGAPRLEFSPVMRRAVEVAEYVLTAAILPLALWVIGAYAAMRAL